MTGNKPIKILQVFSRTDCGGAETLVMTVMRNIDRSRFHFDFIKHTTDHCYYDDEIQNLGGKVYSLPQFSFRHYFKFITAWGNFISYHQYDIVHIHYFGQAGPIARICRQNGINNIFIHIHATKSNGFSLSTIYKSFSLKLAGKYGSQFFACSTDAGKSYYSKTKANNNWSVIKNGIDERKFIFSQAKRKMIRSQLGLNEQNLIMFHSGRFMPEKNHSFIIDVFSALKKIYHNALLIFAGDGLLMKDVQKQVLELGLSESVKFLGIRNDIPQLLSASDIFIFPSKFEGLGISLIEAQASGLPCIASTAIPPEAKINDSTVFIPLSKPAEYWVTSIVELIKKPLNRLECIENVLSHGYNLSAMIQKFEEIYSL